MKPTLALLALTAALGLAALPAPAAALSVLRCEDEVIRIGDYASQVLRACGDPEYREVVSGDDQRRVEHWVYDVRWTRFPRLLVVASGRVVDIDRLDD